MNWDKLKFLLVFILLTFFKTTSAQIGGISASKVASYCVTPVGNHSVEFEPSFSATTAKTYWDDKGKQQDLFASSDSIAQSSGLSWRISYGLIDKLEIGVSYSPDLSSFSWGAKMAVLEKENVALSLMMGLNTPFGNKNIDTRRPNADEVKSYGLGFINSWAFDETLSLDINLQFQDYFKEAEGISDMDYFISTDIGKYVQDGKTLLIAGIGYQQSTFSSESNQSKWTAYPGISIEWGENFLVVINGALDLAGKNTAKTSGFGIALTTTLH